MKNLLLICSAKFLCVENFNTYKVAKCFDKMYVIFVKYHLKKDYSILLYCAEVPGIMNHMLTDHDDIFDFGHYPKEGNNLLIVTKLSLLF